MGTVKVHNRRIFDKLGVQRRTEAVAPARELGLDQGRTSLKQCVFNNALHAIAWVRETWRWGCGNSALSRAGRM